MEENKTNKADENKKKADNEKNNTPLIVSLATLGGVICCASIVLSCCALAMAQKEGPKGDTGEIGLTGKNGYSVLTGNGTPESSLGENGDSYIDLDTWDYYVKSNETWNKSGNIKGTTGAKGDTGAQGEKGDQGIQGEKGDKGDAGDQGIQGEKGDQGIQGEKGDTGISITNTYIDENGDLIVVFSDGTIHNAGHIKDVNTYTVDFYIGSNLIATKNVLEGSKLSKPTEQETAGYTLTSNWYIVDNGDKVDWRFDGYFAYDVHDNIDLHADGSLINYSISYNTNGGTNDPSNPNEYTVDDDFTFSSPSKDGYAFAGWTDDSNNLVEGVTKGETGNLSLTANWSPNKNNLSVTSNDETKGTAVIISGSGYTDEEIVVEATAKSGNKFNGWFNGSTLVSSDAKYTFVMPANDYDLVAEFVVDSDVALGKVPAISEDGKTVTYGLYPQTNVNDEALITELNKITTPESNGWYLYEGSYYAKRTSGSYFPTGYKFDNGVEIKTKTSYWFKCEPIIWKVLNIEEGNLDIVCSVALETGKYGSDSNYDTSVIRTYLNNDLYNSAFSLDDTKIVNSSTFGNEDKIFLLSRDEYENTKYGFVNNINASETRKVKVTDYARIRCEASVNGDYTSYYCNYWTRAYGSGVYAPSVTNDGGLGGSSRVTGVFNNGIVPAITLKTK